MTAYIKQWAFLPLDVIGARLPLVKNELTVKPKSFRPGEVRKPIVCYTEKVPGYLGCPIEWALLKYPNIVFEDRTTAGEAAYYNALPDPHHPRAAPGQEQFMLDLRHAADNYFTTLAKAATGSGKTVAFLDTAARRGRRTLIIVPKQRLARQWAHEINLHLGVPYDDIGWVQGDICNIEHPYNIGILNSLAERVYPDRLYSSIGTIGIDEVHKLGAPYFAAAIGRFYAQSQVALTATDKRKDGADKVFHYFFGKPKVVSSVQALATTVHSIEYRGHVASWVETPEHLAGELAKDERRNALLVRILLRMYDEGRQLLGISHSVQHLQTLAELCIKAGVPAGDIGFYVDKLYTGKTRLSYKVPKVLMRGEQVVFWKSRDGSTDVEKFTLFRVQENLGSDLYRVTGSNGQSYTFHVSEVRNKGVVVPVLDKVDNDQLDYIAAHCPMVLTVYGMFKEGIDIPRLDAGADLIPRSEGTQVIGRIRRPMPNKPKPVWYTLRDAGSPIALKSWDSRVREYRQSNCEVIEHGPLS